LLAVYGQGLPAGFIASKDASLLSQTTLPIPDVSLRRLPALASRVFVVSAALAVVAALIWFALLFGTRAVGYEPAKANGTSMEPALHHGDALVLGQIDAASVQIGDVVWALHEGWPIMHRVVDIYTDARGERIVITKGDNLPEADPPVRASDVQGRLVAKVPALGATARTVGLGDGFQLLTLLVQGFAATSLVLGLVYLQDVRRGANALRRSTSPAGLIDEA
jgi:signal peptidase I